MDHLTVAILGGGPIGLEAAVLCWKKGLEFRLFERGVIGDNVLKWGHVKLFSPFGINSSPEGRELLLAAHKQLPDDEQLLTGNEFVYHYLSPLAEQPELAPHISQHCDAKSIGRENQLKRDNITNANRSASRFRLLLESNGEEMIAAADYVLDCTGTYGNHNWLGNGGMPCPGEAQLQTRIRYDLPDILGKDKAAYAGKHVLVIGSGYSAATNIVALAQLAKSGTTVTWVTRNTDEHPILPIVDDGLEERACLTSLANQFTTDENSNIKWMPGFVVDSIRQAEDCNGGILVQVSSLMNTVSAEIKVDRVLANVGFRPDRTLHEELHVQECYASHGPIKLAATLLGETSRDCLTQSSHGLDILRNPEPNYFILGAKSYGRNSRFLIKIGLEQVGLVINEIAECVNS